MPRERFSAIFREREDEVRAPKGHTLRAHLHETVAEQHVEMPPYRGRSQGQLPRYVVYCRPADPPE